MDTLIPTHVNQIKRNVTTSMYIRDHVYIKAKQIKLSDLIASAVNQIRFGEIILDPSAEYDKAFLLKEIERLRKVVATLQDHIHFTNEKGDVNHDDNSLPQL